MLHLYRKPLRVCVLICVCMCGCSCNRQEAESATANSSGVHRKEKEGMTVSTSQAIRAAESYLREKALLPPKYEVKATTQENDTWDVVFTELPGGPGLFTVVTVDKNGSVIRVDFGE